MYLSNNVKSKAFHCVFFTHFLFFLLTNVKNCWRECIQAYKTCWLNFTFILFIRLDLYIGLISRWMYSIEYILYKMTIEMLYILSTFPFTHSFAENGIEKSSDGRFVCSCDDIVEFPVSVRVKRRTANRIHSHKNTLFIPGCCLHASDSSTIPKRIYHLEDGVCFFLRL